MARVWPNGGRYPDKDYIGIEVHNGVGHLLMLLNQQGIITSEFIVTCHRNMEHKIAIIVCGYASVFPHPWPQKESIIKDA